MIVDELVRRVREGRPMGERLLLEIQKDPYRAFGLQKAVGVRPSILKYEIPIDDHYLRAVVAAVAKSPRAGERIGTKGQRTPPVREEDLAEHWATYVDMQPLNDVCTKWCTRTYFPDAFARISMVANTIRLFDRLRDTTGLPVDIVFKGGVMIRLVLLEFFNDLPLEARVRAMQILDATRALSISDFDFEAVPRDHSLDTESTHRFTLVTYAVLLWLQERMQHEIERESSSSASSSASSHHSASRLEEGSEGGLLNASWDVADKRAELLADLRAAVAKVPNASAFYGATIDSVVVGDGSDAPPSSLPSGYRTKRGRAHPPRRDNKLIFACDAGRCAVPAGEVLRRVGLGFVPTESGGSRLYATMNAHIGEEGASVTTPGSPPPRKGYLRSTFTLSRIKHSFVVYYTTRGGERRCERLSGEMIDLSQSHGVHVDARRKFVYTQTREAYRSYPIIGVDSRIALRSYSPEGFLLDHVVMLHGTDAECYRAPKREKRMSRCVAFLLTHVLSPDVPGARERKMVALRRLADALRAPDTLRRAIPLGTGIAVIDDFAVRERDGIAGASSAEATAYLRGFDPLRALLDVFRIPQGVILSRRFLEYGDVFYYS
jgi:hypothetical protein